MSEEQYIKADGHYYGQYEALWGPRKATRTYVHKSDFHPGDHWQERFTCMDCDEEIIFFTRIDASNQDQVDPARYTYFRTVCACEAHKVGEQYIPKA